MSAQELRTLAERALQSEREKVQARSELFARECAHYEQRNGMTTERFLETFEAGALGDEEEYFDWYAAAQGRLSWDERRRNLDEVIVLSEHIL
jgi:hypothetical protein